MHTVKPYIPYDIVPSSYKLPMATAANGSKLSARDLVVPEWIVGAISGLIYDPSVRRQGWAVCSYSISLLCCLPPHLQRPISHCCLCASPPRQWSRSTKVRIQLSSLLQSHFTRLLLMMMSMMSMSMMMHCRHRPAQCEASDGEVDHQHGGGGYRADHPGI